MSSSHSCQSSVAGPQFLGAFFVGDAQAMLDQAQEAKGSIGLMSGRFKTAEIMALSRAFPLGVTPHFPEIEKELAKVMELDSDWVPNKEAKPLLAMLVDSGDNSHVA